MIFVGVSSAGLSCLDHSGFGSIWFIDFISERNEVEHAETAQVFCCFAAPAYAFSAWGDGGLQRPALSMAT